MLKYMNIEGYNNLGEISHHVYGWRDNKTKTTDILINAYVNEQKVTKFKLNFSKETYAAVELTENEKNQIKELIGDYECTNDVTDILAGFPFKKEE